MNGEHPNSPASPTTETVVQRFRPYCCHAHGGHDGQVRLNPKGMYVRWQDYERLRDALAVLLPGLVLDLRYADMDDDKDAMRARTDPMADSMTVITQGTFEWTNF